VKIYKFQLKNQYKIATTKKLAFPIKRYNTPIRQTSKLLTQKKLNSYKSTTRPTPKLLTPKKT